MSNRNGRASLEFAQALDKGEQLGAFSVSAVLGVDGFYITYLGQHNRGTDHVVVRECFPSGAAVRAPDGNVVPASGMHEGAYSWAVEHCVAQANLLSKLNHPNIIRVRDFFADRNTAYVVTEHLQGSSLERTVREQGPLSQERTSTLGREVGSAIAAMHEQRLLHRAVNPETITVRPDGSAVLAEFSSACPLEAVVEAPPAQQKPGYDLRGEADPAGPMHDIYALSATLYFALTGKRLPDVASRRQTTSADAVDPLAFLDDNSQSEWLALALRRGLAVDPEARPASVLEWLELGSAPAPAPAADTQNAHATTEKPTPGPEPGASERSPDADASRPEGDVLPVGMGVAVTTDAGRTSSFGLNSIALIAGLAALAIAAVALWSPRDQVEQQHERARLILQQGPTAQSALREAENIYAEILAHSPENKRALAARDSVNAIQRYVAARETGDVDAARTAMRDAEATLERAGLPPTLFHEPKSQFERESEIDVVMGSLVDAPLDKFAQSSARSVLQRLALDLPDDNRVGAAIEALTSLEAAREALAEQSFHAARASVVKASEAVAALGFGAEIGAEATRVIAESEAAAGALNSEREPAAEASLPAGAVAKSVSGNAVLPVSDAKTEQGTVREQTMLGSDGVATLESEPAAAVLADAAEPAATALALISAPGMPQRVDNGAAQDSEGLATKTALHANKQESIPESPALGEATVATDVAATTRAVALGLATLSAGGLDAGMLRDASNAFDEAANTGGMDHEVRVGRQALTQLAEAQTALGRGNFADARDAVSKAQSIANSIATLSLKTAFTQIDALERTNSGQALAPASRSENVEDIVSEAQNALRRAEVGLEQQWLARAHDTFVRALKRAPNHPAAMAGAHFARELALALSALDDTDATKALEHLGAARRSVNNVPGARTLLLAAGKRFLRVRDQGNITSQANAVNAVPPNIDTHTPNAWRLGGDDSN